VSRQRDQRVNPDAYRPPPGLTLEQRAAEQDAAAGGRSPRRVTREDGAVVSASVALRCYPKSRRVYAYLRWAEPTTGTAERYLGDVSEFPDRTTALRAAWGHALDGTFRSPRDTHQPART